MVNRPRIIHNKKPKQGMAIADCKIAINGCQVLMGHPDPAHATATARQFKAHLADVINRAGCVNMSDFYNAYLEVNRKLEIGESIWN